MSHFARAAVAAIVLLISTPSSAAVRDGNALLQQCTATIGAFMAFCFGYIDAITDSMLEKAGNGGVEVCFSAEPDEPQLRNIVVKFLERNDALRRLGAPN